MVLNKVNLTNISPCIVQQKLLKTPLERYLQYEDSLSCMMSHLLSLRTPCSNSMCSGVCCSFTSTCSIYFAVCRLGRIMSCPCEYPSGQLGYYAPLHYHFATAPPYYAAKRHFSASHKTKTGVRQIPVITKFFLKQGIPSYYIQHCIN